MLWTIQLPKELVREILLSWYFVFVMRELRQSEPVDKYVVVHEEGLRRTYSIRLLPSGFRLYTPVIMVLDDVR
jgi:hypothetical protein